MSEITVTTQTRNQLNANYDVSKFALGQNSFIAGEVTASGADVDLVQGMVIGRIGATQKLVPLAAAATDGSQFPVGLALLTQTVADGTTATVSLVNKGQIAEGKINFLGAETLATLVGPASNQRSIRDYLNDLGLELVSVTELTAYDNS